MSSKRCWSLMVCDMPGIGHQRNSWPDSCYFMPRLLSKLDSVVTGNQHFLLSTTQSFFCSTDPFLNPDQGSLFSGLSLDKGFCWVPWSLTSLTLGATGRGPWTDLGLLWLLWTPEGLPSSSADLLYLCPEFCLTFFISSISSVSFLFQLLFCSHLHVPVHSGFS